MLNLFSCRYAKLNFSYDKEKVKEEILQHDLIDIPAIKKFLNLRPFDIVSKDLYERLTVVTETGIVEGEIPSWKGYSFTHVTGDMMSEYGGNLTRIKFEDWQWKKDANCPYIQKLVKTLGFVQVQNVRAMVLNPPGFGPVHNDVPPESKYYEDHVSITLNIDDGGVPLIALINNNFKDINEDCFLFRDDCWHGVGLVKSPRIQLRINGKINLDRLGTLINKETII